jgi:hypothetical protein
MILCADDFGLSEDIDAAILELCSLGQISAVSCMVLFERCSPNLLAELQKYRRQIDLGLHLCFTDENLPFSQTPGMEPLVFPSFASCLRGGFQGKLQPRDVLPHIATQYQLFTTKCRIEPDYIDGHLHIHQSPLVREALIEFVLRLPKNRRPYVRNTYLSLGNLRQQRLPWSKAWLIARFGKRMRQRLRSAGIRTNDGFAGIYDFRRARAFAQYFPGFIKCLENPTGILVVHPGRKESWRRQEFETLRSTKLTVTLNRFEA